MDVCAKNHFDLTAGLFSVEKQNKTKKHFDLSAVLAPFC